MPEVIDKEVIKLLMEKAKEAFEGYLCCDEKMGFRRFMNGELNYNGMQIIPLKEGFRIELFLCIYFDDYVSPYDEHYDKDAAFINIWAGREIKEIRINKIYVRCNDRKYQKSRLKEKEILENLRDGKRP